MSRPSTIVIVGAGPYGLSVAAHLRRHGLPFRIFGSPMQTWSNMPGGMFLKSEGRASNLSDSAGSYTLKAHCEQYGLSYGEYGVPVPLETFVDYGLKFQQRLVPEVEDTRVLALRRSAHGYELQTATGELLAAKSVVVAVGISHFRHIPRRLAHLPRELVSHTSHHQSFAAFSGRDLTVIGGGQSALETAALAREQGANVRVLVRQPRLVWNGAPHQEPRRTAQRLRCPTTGLGDGWRLRFYANSPGAFHRLPERMRVRWWQGRPRCRPASRRRPRTCISSGWRPRTASGRPCGFSTARTTAPTASSVTSWPGRPGRHPWRRPCADPWRV
jgi:FAD-dependent urate hydroxylase